MAVLQFVMDSGEQFGWFLLAGKLFLCAGRILFSEIFRKSLTEAKGTFTRSQ